MKLENFSNNNEQIKKLDDLGGNYKNNSHNKIDNNSSAELLDNLGKNENFINGGKKIKKGKKSKTAKKKQRIVKNIKKGKSKTNKKGKSKTNKKNDTHFEESITMVYGHFKITIININGKIIEKIENLNTNEVSINKYNDYQEMIDYYNAMRSINKCNKSELHPRKMKLYYY